MEMRVPVAELDAQLDALELALQGEDYARAGVILQAHEAHLQLVYTLPLGAADKAPLQALLERHQRLSLRMHEQRDALSVLMAGNHRSHRAASAYLQAQARA